MILRVWQEFCFWFGFLVTLIPFMVWVLFKEFKSYYKHMRMVHKEEVNND